VPNLQLGKTFVRNENMMRKTRNEVAVGMTVLAVLVLATYIIVMLADWSSLGVAQQKITVKVHYKVGLKGLQVGSPVHLGGVKIGNVTDTQIRRLGPGATDPNEVYVFFTMKMPQQYQLRSDCVLAPKSNLLGGETLLVVEDLGGEGEIVSDGQTVELALADDTMEAIKREFNINDPNSLLSRMKSDIPAISGAIQQTLAKVDLALDVAVSALREFSPKDPNSLLARAKDDVLAITGQMRSSLSKADSALDSARAALREFDPNDPNSLLARAKIDVLGITGRMQLTLGKVDSALDNARAALKNLRQYTGDERIDRIIGNINEVTVNLKLTSQEVRRAPWKLLHRPKKKESEMQALVDSAGAFAAAAERLDSAALRLHRLTTTTDDQLLIDKDRIKSMVSELETSFEQYRQAEQKFWEDLK